MRNERVIARTRPKSHDWDVICVGSGITALAYGALMAKYHPGERVLVLESHYVPGGYASQFRRKRLRFDCSLHKLSGMGEAGNLRAIFAELGLLDELKLVLPDHYFRAQLSGGADICFPNDVQRYHARLCERFPEEHEAIALFMEDVMTHGKNGYYQFQIMDGSYVPDMQQLRFAHKTLRRMTVSEALVERLHVRDADLSHLLTVPCIYVGGFPEDLNYLYFLHVVYATLVCGNAYVQGGAQRLSDALVARIEESGGQLLLRTPADEILVDATDRAYGVRTARGCFHAATICVNAAPHYAMRALFPGRACLEKATAQLTQLRPSSSTATLYVATDEDPVTLGVAVGETMLFGADVQTAADMRRRCAERDPVDDETAFEDAFWRASSMQITNYHSLDPQAGRILCLNVLDAMRHWPHPSTPAYVPKKQRCEQVLRERLLAALPGLRGHIAYAELASPHTYERYTNNVEGAGYGALVGTSLAGFNFHYGFPIQGVQFLSAWVAGPSYEAAFGYGAMRAKTYRRPDLHARVPEACAESGR